MLTHAQLLETISYDPDTGLFRLLKGTNRRDIGSIINADVLVPQRGGRLVRRTVLRFCLRNFAAGRVAYFYMTGEWPPAEVDHENNDGWDQRWHNLRPASRSQNQANTRCYGSNKLGLKGVYRRSDGTFRAMIQKDGRRLSLGSFSTESAAHAAYTAAASQLHGGFARAA